MSQSSAMKIKELMDKIHEDEEKMLVQPIASIREKIAIIEKMSYKELSEKDKSVDSNFLKRAYSYHLNKGKTPSEARDASLEIMRKKLEENRTVIINKLKNKEKEINDRYTKLRQEDINKLKSVIEHWDIKRTLKTAPDFNTANTYATVYAIANNFVKQEKISVKDLLIYFPMITQKNDVLEITLRDKSNTRYYSTELFNSVRISPKGFIFISTEYTENYNISEENYELSPEEAKETAILNGISPKEFKFKMFNSPITEYEIIDRCGFSYCNYSNRGKSVAGIRIQYEGPDALQKFYSVWDEVFPSDAFHDILNKTSMFLASDFINYKDIIKERLAQIQ